MTPNYCYDVLESVTNQIYSVYEVFNKTFPDFKSRGGKCSLIGHSLGSVICWDLLSLKKKSLQKSGNEHEAHITASMTASNAANIGLQQQSNENEVEAVRAGTNNDYGGGAWGPSLQKPYDTVIPFKPEFTMFIGSPIGLFLSLRGAHAVFDSIRQADPQKPRVSPFTLPTRAVYNIFSPSDPVAYRIEPLLLAHGTEGLPDPLYLTRLGEGVRLHVKALQLVSYFTGSSGKSVPEEASKTEKPETKSERSDSPKSSKEESTPERDDSGELKFLMGGKSMRLDYVSIKHVQTAKMNDQSYILSSDHKE